MKLLFFSNVPSPYRIDFFNELGKDVDLTVVFEAKSVAGISFNWNIDQIKNFEAVFLKEGDIHEKRIDWSILKYIKKNYYDYIFVTSYAYLTEMIALLAVKILKIPYFLEIDGGLIRTENRIKKMFKTFLISNAAGYFSPSKSTDDFLIHYGAKNNLIFRYPFTSIKFENIIPIPVSNDEKIELRKELKISEKKIVLAVGQFIKRKGFDVLINASKNLDSNTGIIFVGGTPPDEYNDLKTKLGLHNIYFEGFKSKKELDKYYKAADLFVLPTREDVWGLVINEAMSFGLPIITTNKCVAGLELVENEENGFIVPVDEEQLLSDKINKILLNEKILKEMSNKSHEKIKNYTIENMAKKHLEILIEIKVKNEI